MQFFTPTTLSARLALVLVLSLLSYCASAAPQRHQKRCLVANSDPCLAAADCCPFTYCEAEAYPNGTVYIGVSAPPSSERISPCLQRYPGVLAGVQRGAVPQDHPAGTGGPGPREMLGILGLAVWMLELTLAVVQGWAFDKHKGAGRWLGASRSETCGRKGVLLALDARRVRGWGISRIKV